MTEEAFRQSIRGLVEKEFGFKVERWIKLDREGVVFGYPSHVDIDVAISDEKTILVEVKSTSDNQTSTHSRGRLETLKTATGDAVRRGESLEVAKHLKIEIYTRI